VRIGIDLGGTKIEGVLLASDGRELRRDRIATPRQDYPSVLDAIAQLVARLAEETSGGAIPVGVGTPGFLSPRDGRIVNSNLLTLNGQAIDADLTARLGRPVRVANDAQCFVLSEATDGAGAAAGKAGAKPGPDIVFGATLGTGVGGGFAVDGRVLDGANGSAGQWSHTTLPFLREEDGSGGTCFCGHASCIERFLAGRGLAWDFERSTGEALSPEEIGRLERAGDPRASATFARYEDRLARALAAVINFVDPRVIVLGGGVSNNARLFQNVPRLLGRYTVAPEPITPVVRAQHGDASGVRGAAWLWPAV
jgi:fructokinase